MSLHDGHRQRLIQRFLRDGLDGFDEHNILELLLFYAIPRKDTNPLAHVLLDHFGSLAGVLDASPQELQSICGVGENTAAFLKLLPELTRIYCSQRQEEVCLSNSAQAGNYLMPRFIGRQEETVLLVCLDAKYRVLSCSILHKGSVNSAEVNTRKLLSVALKHNAVSIILAHNHPGGIALPSEEDIRTTNNIKSALSAAGIRLFDHIIVADHDFVSLSDSGYC